MVTNSIDKKNIVITGLPRSGTTLICHLLDKIDNTIALNEPWAVRFNNSMSVDEICLEIPSKFSNDRRSIIEESKVLTKHVNGVTPDNVYGKKLNEKGLRINENVRGHIEIRKKLNKEFNLCVKHPAVFTYLLAGLSKKFPCHAVIRNPLAVLASWNSADIAVGRGTLPAAEHLDFELNSALKDIPNKIDRQIHILNWFFGHFRKNESMINIIRYEDVIESQGSSLQSVIEGAKHLNEPMSLKNNNKLYDSELMQVLGKKLLNSQGDVWHFYTRTAVEQVMHDAVH